MKKESFLPKKAFAGSDKHKLGIKGQARGEPGRSQKAPLTGLMVGEEQVDEISDKLAKSAAKGRWDKTTSAVDSAKELQTKGSVSQAKKELEKAKRHKELQAQRTARLKSISESVIIGPDESGDWTNPQVQILGGGGSYTLDRLYKKAQSEAAGIKELIDAGEYKKAAYHLKQFRNTVDTIVVAKDELSKRHFGESKQRLDPKCWKGYRKQGTKMKGDVRVNNCVKVKEGFEDEFVVLYINGQPKTKYENIFKAREDAKFLKDRFPNIKIELKKAMTNFAAIDESTNCVKIDENWNTEISNLIKILESK